MAQGDAGGAHARVRTAAQVELVGGGPDFLIALADHPMMPPHNTFAHVVDEDMGGQNAYAYA